MFQDLHNANLYLRLLVIIFVLIPEEYLFIRSFLPRFYYLCIIVHYVFICGLVHECWCP